MGNKKPVSLKKILRPQHFVPADKKIDAQLRSFKARKLHQAIVLDKEGKVVGLDLGGYLGGIGGEHLRRTP